MAAGAIELVRHYEHDTPYDLDLQRTLYGRASLPPATDVPCRSMRLD
jgi:hypothetical protein